MRRTKLEPGFRFHPTDVELVRYYLKRKVMGKKFLTDTIIELDIYKFEPPDLPDMSCQRTGDLKWYFFCPREKKYPKGGKAKRSTECGYWKATGKDRDVSYNNEVVGKIKTLIYHFGKKTKNHCGERTDWVMYEYRLEDNALAQKNIPQDSYVICMVYKKNGLGPRHGDQYGAPFNENEWSSDDEIEENTDNLVARNTDTGPSNAPKDCFNGVVSESCVSHVPNDVVAYTPFLEATQAPLDDGDNNVNSLLDNFFVNNNYEFSSLDGFENHNEVRHDETSLSVVEEDPVCLEDDDLLDMDYELLINLDDLTEPSTPPPGQDGSHSDSRSSGET